MKRGPLLGAGALLITIAAVIIGLDDISRILGRITPLELALLTALQLFTIFLTSYIWFFLLKQKTAAVSIFNVFLINMAGVFVESVTPSAKIGGETMKIYLMRRESSLSYQDLTSIMIVSKFYSLLPFLIISLLTLGSALLFVTLPPVVYAAFLGLAIIICLIGLFFSLHRVRGGRLVQAVRKIGTPHHHPISVKILGKLAAAHAFLSDASATSRTLITNPHNGAYLFLLGFIVWAFYPVKVYLVAAMLGYEISLMLVIIATYTAYLVSMIPLLPGGLLTFEGSMVLVLVSGGLILPEAFSIAIMARVVTFWIPLLISAAVTLLLVRRSLARVPSA
ncbi:lysylphosphatidylglycerol synthase transmembrane domain-containing protein [Candidatus Methanocrinis natronophilus]|uniref:Lysylphosphatidylglycerol synthase transmembrane domain-containing protein n=1 Tax=Candidatus Methanocrinis natronophilus TaxID=3033396 RepID=A0ABT5X501_9EURY|nr:lysylphosphatidylglycerol synthase transmembrane domain-containing protein [Candidatus Methanocrinis natronophilus]MDF0589764.1 lysylphosphatidylglycerol synthase transmembrane domain-containing protein [Candidatus Methanocrinis natronophilus]